MSSVQGDYKWHEWFLPINLFNHSRGLVGMLVLASFPHWTISVIFPSISSHSTSQQAYTLLPIFSNSSVLHHLTSYFVTNCNGLTTWPISLLPGLPIINQSTCGSQNARLTLWLHWQYMDGLIPTLFNNTGWMTAWLANEKLWNRVMAYFNVLSQHFPGRPNDNENTQLDQPSPHLRSKTTTFQI